MYGGNSVALVSWGCLAFGTDGVELYYGYSCTAKWEAACTAADARPAQLVFVLQFCRLDVAQCLQLNRFLAHLPVSVYHPAGPLSASLQFRLRANHLVTWPFVVAVVMTIPPGSAI